MANGNTLISPRNFDCLLEVDSKGKMVRKIARRIAHPLTVQIKRRESDPNCRDHKVEMIRDAFELDDRE